MILCEFQVKFGPLWQTIRIWFIFLFLLGVNNSEKHPVIHPFKTTEEAFVLRHACPGNSAVRSLVICSGKRHFLTSGTRGTLWHVNDICPRPGMDIPGALCYNAICEVSPVKEIMGGKRVNDAVRNNELRGLTAMDLDIIPSDSEHVFQEAARYQQVMMRYHCAILEMRTKLEVLSHELSVRYRRNPIEFIESRLKRPASIARKLRRLGFPVSVESMQENLSDIAGIRVLCAYIDDIYEIARMLARQRDVQIITVKDYIKTPKENGYRSYHLIVEIPVSFSDSVQPVRCEIQIRTIAMDFWATLDHDMQYKKKVEDSEEITRELRECAEIIHQTDEKMMRLRERIHRIDEE